MLPRIEGFEILSPLGTGAMSTVYRALDSETGRTVALKVLHPHIAYSASAVERFLHEVRAYERLHHPNVIACLRGGRSGEHWFVALEYLDGGDLRELLRKTGRLPAEAAAYVLQQVLGALAHAHAAGVVHRDVKPENVMLAADGTLKLADFGISKALDFTRLTEAGTLLGTPAYMAPEQLASGSADARSDLWSVGVLLYELVTGGNPFAAESAAETASRLAALSPAPLGYRAPGVPERLDDVLARLLVRDPEARAARAEEALELLAPVLASAGPLGTAAGFRALAADPVETLRRWAAEQAAVHVRAARSLRSGTEDALPAAYLHALEALAVDPGCDAAEALAAELGPRVGARRVRSPSPRAVELEREAEQNPASLLALVNLVRTARADGDLLGAARAYRWGRRRSPRDRFAAMQLATALGFELAAHLEGTEAGKLRLRLQGGGGESAARKGTPYAFVVTPPVWIAALALGAVLVLDRLGARQGERSVRRLPPASVREVADAGDLYLEKGRAVEDGGDAERALALYDRFLRENLGDARAPEALFRSGRALEQLGRYEEAKARYGQLLEEAPGADVTPRARRRLAALLDAAGDVDGALAALQPSQTMGEFEDRAHVQLLRARLLEKKGDLEGAIALYDALLALQPEAYIQARARLGRGRALLLRGDREGLRWIAEAEALAGPGSLVRTEAAELRRRALVP